MCHTQVAAPGTSITYTDLGSNQQSTIKLLGPWDPMTDDVFNYLAPFAQPLLGKQIGDEVTLKSDGADRLIRIDAVESIV